MSRTKYIADQYKQIDSLLERMRQQEVQQTPADNRVQDVVEKDPGQGAFTPAHANKIDVGREYTNNLAMINAANPESYARGIGKNAAPPVFEEKGADIHPGQQHQTGVGVRGGRNTVQSRVEIEQPSQEVAGHLRYGATGQIVADATKELEQLYQNSQNQPTRIDQAGASQSSDELPAEQQYFDAATEQVAGNGREQTNVDFAYVEGESAYDKWLEENAGGAEIQAGEGAQLSEKYKNDLTATYAVDKPTNKA